MHDRRLHSQDEQGGVNLGLIITPMLDMAFQLMAFFIMTYHPSALEGHFDIKMLPPKDLAVKAKDKSDPKKDDTPLADEEPQLQDVLIVSIKAVKPGQTEGMRTEGDPNFIKLYYPPPATEPTTFSIEDKTDLNEREQRALDAFEATLEKQTPERKRELMREKKVMIFFEAGLEKLAPELKKFLENPANSNANIKLEPDADLKHKYLMTAYDACKQAGFQNIQFIAPALSKAGQ